jgi:hypothetical protein
MHTISEAPTEPETPASRSSRRVGGNEAGKDIVIFRLQRPLSSQTPNLSRSSVIDLADSGVESLNAAETRSEGNITHPQIRLVDRRLRKVHLARLSDRARRCPQVLRKQTTEVTRSGEAFSHGFLTGVFTYERSRNSRRYPTPRRSALNAIRPVRSSLSLQSGTANNKKSGSSQPRIRSRIVMPAFSQVHSSNHSSWN